MKLADLAASTINAAAFSARFAPALAATLFTAAITGTGSE